ncbi:ABC transporter ATP-binding protein [Mangrovicoccus sp. HB161399]|uniref:ABC transporter ATP-binding protein n=1 Tax=Mangrovicoccus sp. HB161399 TaxID=2720392 RepID=UPI001555D964|nr:ATP-binding cassette domain-containing protein [Mangrovicoccus sp. HB161399]
MKDFPHASEGAAIGIDGLGIRFGHHDVISDLSLDILPGEFLVLLGPSGCGKSTLLNAVAGLIDVHAGTISISGRDVTRAEPKDRGIGMVFQSYALYPRMSVAQNMGFGLRVGGMAKAEIAERVQRTAKFLQLESLLGRRPADLSGGQRQRVAIGRALVRDAEVFLFDEPLSNLDAQLRADLRVEIKRLHQSLGSTMLYVTHDQVEAMTLADRIVVMKGGEIQQIGAPAEIYGRPANLFVAGFLGTPKMNFLEGDVAAESGRRMFRAEGLRLDVTGMLLDNPDFAGPATLGLRPEDLSPAGPGEEAPLAGEVTLTEPLGPETIVWAALGAGQVSLRMGAENFPAPGDRLHIRPDLARASLFDRATGRRL